MKQRVYQRRRPPTGRRETNSRPRLEALEDRAVPTSAFAAFGGGLTPSFVTDGPDGNLWFTDATANKVGTISLNAATFGNVTEYSQGLTAAAGLGPIVKASGNLYFVESSANKIGQITPAGIITEFTIPTADSNPQGIAGRPDGTVWFTECNTDKVGQFIPQGTGTFKEFATAAGGQPTRMTLGSDGNLWFLEQAANQIGRVDPFGNVSEFAGGITPAAGLAGITAGPDSNVWFTEAAIDKVARITVGSGTVTEFSIPSAGVNPRGITAGADGALWFAEQAGNRLGRVTTAGVFSEVGLPPGFSQPASITLSNTNGNLWFTQSGANGLGEYRLPHYFVTGTDVTAGPQVAVLNAYTTTFEASFTAYASGFTGGVRVALGDVNGDGIPDIVTGPGPGGGPDVRVYDGSSLRLGTTPALLAEFMAFDPGFTGGVNVATGDFNGDGKADIVVAADTGGGPDVRVFNIANNNQLIREFFAYGVSFTGGVRVAVADTNGDGADDVVTSPGAGGGPNVRVYSGKDNALLQDFFAYSTTFTGGVYVAAADTNADGKADIVTGAGQGGGPHVRVFDGGNVNRVLQSFFAYDQAFTGGVRVAAADMDGNGRADIVTGPGPTGGPQVLAFDGLTLGVLDNFFAYPANSDGVFLTSGIYVGGQ